MWDLKAVPAARSAIIRTRARYFCLKWCFANAKQLFIGGWPLAALLDLRIFLILKSAYRIVTANSATIADLENVKTSPARQIAVMGIHFLMLAPRMIAITRNPPSMFGWAIVP